VKRVLVAYLAGVATVLGYAYHQPDAAVTLGLKLAAFQSDYDWQAVPREAQPVSYSTRDLLAYEEPAGKPAKRKR
jgi:hypothetical protein